MNTQGALLDSPMLSEAEKYNPQSDVSKPEIPTDRLYRKEIAKNRLNALEAEYRLWEPAFRDIQTYIAPLRGEFLTDPGARAKMIDHKKLLDSYGVHAGTVLGTGLTSGMTSPTSPWVRLELDINRELLDDERAWLDRQQDVLYSVMNRSNVYDTLDQSHLELGGFGTGCFIVLEDYETVVRCRYFTIGTYFLSVDATGRISGFGRRFYYSVGQMVSEFGLKNCSAQVQTYWHENKKDIQIRISHLIEVNDTRAGDLKDFKNMKYRSVYWDDADDQDRFLATRGFKSMRVIAPRWQVKSPTQPYGYGQGWYALGNCKELQKAKYDKIVSREKAHTPPMIQDANVDGHSSYIPGGVTKTSSTLVPNAGVRPAYQIQHDAQGHQITRDELRGDIDRDFYVDLFKLLISQQQMSDNTQKTAFEIAEKKQEALMQMGPVLYRIQKDELDPLIELIWEICVDNDLIEPAPASLEGVPIKIIHISILAQAQRAIGVNQVNRVIAFVANLNSISPAAAAEGASILNIEENVRVVAKMEGTPAKILKDPALVAAEKKAIAEANQAQMNSEMMSKTAKGMADMGRIPMADGKTNAAEQLLKSRGVVAK